MDSKSAVETVTHTVIAIWVWAVVLMAASLVFTAAWNYGVSPVFGMTRLGSMESLCMLVCAWILSRIVLPKVTLEVRA